MCSPEEDYPPALWYPAQHLAWNRLPVKRTGSSASDCGPSFWAASAASVQKCGKKQAWTSGPAMVRVHSTSLRSPGSSHVTPNQSHALNITISTNCNIFLMFLIITKSVSYRCWWGFNLFPHMSHHAIHTQIFQSKTPSVTQVYYMLGIVLGIHAESRCSHIRYSSVQFSGSVMSASLQPHESQHARPPCPSPTPGVHPDSHPSSRWCHPAISSSVVHLSSGPQSLPASGSFPMSQLFVWGGQSTGISALASFLPKNTQDWSPLEWTGWISL